jgi:hypothetical protein
MRARRWLLVLLVLALLLGVGVLFAYRQLSRIVEAQIRLALGSDATIRSLELTWNGAGVNDLRVPAPPGAPTPYMMKADRIWVAPSLRSLFTNTLNIASVTIDGAYLLMRRTPSGLAVPVPAGSGGAASTGRIIEIHRLEIPNATIDWDDRSVSPPVRLRLSPVSLTFSTLSYPPARPVNLTIEGQFAGQQPGRLAITGWTHPQSLESQLQIRLTGVDLIPLQPYFLSPRDARLSSGQFDLSMQSHVKASHLTAPGQLTLINLQFAPGQGAFQTFAGVPRDALVRFLQANGRLEVQFVAEGPLNSPQFTLQDTMARQIALAMAVKEIGKELIEAGAKGAEGLKKEGEALGKTLRGLFK